MSIKSDLWIRRMAESEKMIEPFEPGQVRHHTDERLDRSKKGHLYKILLFVLVCHQNSILRYLQWFLQEQ